MAAIRIHITEEPPKVITEKGYIGLVSSPARTSLTFAGKSAVVTIALDSQEITQLVHILQHSVERQILLFDHEPDHKEHTYTPNES